MTNYFARTEYSYSGNNTLAIGFTYRKAEDVRVSINGVDTPSFTISNGQIVLASGVASTDDKIVIYRDTSQSSRLVSGFQGDRLAVSETLETDSLQAFNMAQEALDSSRVAHARAGEAEESTEIAALDARLSATEAKNAAQDTSINTNTSQLSELLETVNTLRAAGLDTQQTAEAIALITTHLNSRLASYYTKTETDTQITGLTTRINALETQIQDSSDSSEITRLEGEIADLQTQITTLQNSVPEAPDLSGIQSELDLLNTRLNNIVASDANIASLNFDEDTGVLTLRLVNEQEYTTTIPVGVLTAGKVGIEDIKNALFVGEETALTLPNAVNGIKTISTQTTPITEEGVSTTTTTTTSNSDNALSVESIPPLPTGEDRIITVEFNSNVSSFTRPPIVSVGLNYRGLDATFFPVVLGTYQKIHIPIVGQQESGRPFLTIRTEGRDRTANTVSIYVFKAYYQDTGELVDTTLNFVNTAIDKKVSPEFLNSLRTTQARVASYTPSRQLTDGQISRLGMLEVDDEGNLVVVKDLINQQTQIDQAHSEIELLDGRVSTTEDKTQFQTAETADVVGTERTQLSTGLNITLVDRGEATTDNTYSSSVFWGNGTITDPHTDITLFNQGGTDATRLYTRGGLVYTERWIDASTSTRTDTIRLGDRDGHGLYDPIHINLGSTDTFTPTAATFTFTQNVPTAEDTGNYTIQVDVFVNVGTQANPAPRSQHTYNVPIVNGTLASQAILSAGNEVVYISFDANTRIMHITEVGNNFAIDGGYAEISLTYQRNVEVNTPRHKVATQIGVLNNGAFSILLNYNRPFNAIQLMLNGHFSSWNPNNDNNTIIPKSPAGLDWTNLWNGLRITDLTPQQSAALYPHARERYLGLLQTTHTAQHQIKFDGAVFGKDDNGNEVRLGAGGSMEEQGWTKLLNGELTRMEDDFRYLLNIPDPFNTDPLIIGWFSDVASGYSLFRFRLKDFIFSAEGVSTGFISGVVRVMRQSNSGIYLFVSYNDTDGLRLSTGNSFGEGLDGEGGKFRDIYYKPFNELTTN